MKTKEFDYNLPSSFIANKPLSKRDESKLLVLDRKIKSTEIIKFKNIIDYFEPGDLIVLNDTHVIPARLFGRKPTGGKVEIFLTNRVAPKTWETLVKPGKRFKEGAVVIFDEKKMVKNFSGRVEKVLNDGKRLIKFNYKGKFFKLLSKYGQMPLPPYIKNTPLTEREKRRKYQTIFSKKKGAVAAPTAGLHFTKDLLKKLKSKGIKIAYLTLHVNAGTFLPIKEDKVEDHKMHSEWYEIPKSVMRLIRDTRRRKKKVIACGTTTLRALETIGDSALFSEKIGRCPCGWTDIFIYPGFKFKAVDALITNFHLPKSSLLLLVCAFASKELIIRAYEKAKANGFRFYSFGDAMLII